MSEALQSAQLQSPSIGAFENGACPVCRGESRSSGLSSGPLRVLQCLLCSHGFLDPMPPEGELLDLYEESYFKRFYLPFERQRIGNARRELELIEHFVAPGRLLDVGSGVGHFLAAALERGWQTTGIEPSRFAAQYARKRYGIFVIRSALEQLALPRRPYDVITFWDVLPHLQDPAMALRRVHERLRRGGVLVVKTPNIEARLWRVLGLLDAAVDSTRLIYAPAQMQFFSGESLAALLGRCGFDLVRVGYRRESRPAAIYQRSWRERALRLYYESYRFWHPRESLVVIATKPRHKRAGQEEGHVHP